MTTYSDSGISITVSAEVVRAVGVGDAMPEEPPHAVATTSKTVNN